MYLNPENITKQKGLERHFGKYTIKSTLNSGSFGTVFLVEDENGHPYAVKRLQDNNKQVLDKELQALKTIKGENIVQMIEYFYDEETKLPVIVMEYCEQGDLRDYQCTKMNCIFTEDEALSIFAQILKGFKNIHEKGFIHRDLKERNILMKNNIAKISDFGLAKRLSYNQLTSSRCWTLPYAAPEILQGLAYNYKVDIWSLGVMLFRMLFNSFPFGCYGGDIAQLQGIMGCFTGEVFTLSKTKRKVVQEVSNGVISIFTKVFVVDCDLRADFKELYYEPCLQKYLQDGQGHKAFYTNDFDKIMILQSKHGSDEEKRVQQDDCTEEERENMMASVNREQLFASKMAANNKAQFQPGEQQRESQFKVYLECLNQYFFLVECSNAFSTDPVFQNSVSEELSTGLQFFLIKNIVYYVRGLKEILVSKENTFNIQGIDWPSFVGSKTYSNVLANVKRDEKKWLGSLSDYYERVQIPGTLAFFKNIQQFINEDIDKPEQLEQYHSKIPDSIKLPLRAVLMTCFKSVKESLEQRIANKKKRLLTIEKDIIARILARLILCAAWNRIYNLLQPPSPQPILPKLSIFKANSVQTPTQPINEKQGNAPNQLHKAKTLGTPTNSGATNNGNASTNASSQASSQPNSFEYLYIWLAEATYESIMPEINGIISKYFPFLLESDYNFL